MTETESASVIEEGETYRKTFSRNLIIATDIIKVMTIEFSAACPSVVCIPCHVSRCFRYRPWRPCRLGHLIHHRFDAFSMLIIHLHSIHCIITTNFKTVLMDNDLITITIHLAMTVTHLLRDFLLHCILADPFPSPSRRTRLHTLQTRRKAIVPLLGRLRITQYGQSMSLQRNHQPR